MASGVSGPSAGSAIFPLSAARAKAEAVIKLGQPVERARLRCDAAQNLV